MNPRITHQGSTHPYLGRQKLSRSSKLLTRGQERITREQWRGAIYFLKRSLAAQPSNLEAPLIQVMISGCEKAIAAQEAIDDAIAEGLPTTELQTPRKAYKQEFMARIQEIPPGAFA